jgi:hypothetical protein
MIISLSLLAGFIVLSTMEASAGDCAAGAYRGGCVAAGGAAVVRAPVVVRRPYVGTRGAYVGRRIYRWVCDAADLLIETAASIFIVIFGCLLFAWLMQDDLRLMSEEMT